MSGKVKVSLNNQEQEVRYDDCQEPRKSYPFLIKAAPQFARTSVNSGLKQAKNGTYSSVLNNEEFGFDQTQMDVNDDLTDKDLAIQEMVLSLNQQIDKLQKEKIDVECDRDTLKMELETTEQELEMAKKMVNHNQANTEYYQLLSKYETLEEVNMELKYEINSLTANMQQTKNEMTKELNNHRNSETIQNLLTFNVEKLKSKVLAYEAILERLKRKGIDIEIDINKESCNNNNNNNNDLELTTEELEIHATETKRISENEETLLRAELADLMEKIENARQTFEDISEMKIKLLNEIEAKTTQFNVLKQKNQRLSSNLNQTKAAIEQAKTELKQSEAPSVTVSQCNHGPVDNRLKYVTRGFTLLWFGVYGAIIANAIRNPKQVEHSKGLVKKPF